MKSLHVVITGKVQGVYFRAGTKTRAQELGLAGWVRNTPDGSVEALFEGPEKELAEMLSWCRIGPPMARVTAISCKEGPGTGAFTRFEVI